MHMVTQKNLTIRYSLTQFSFWAASTGAASFAATYLLGCGIPSGVVGTMLAAAGLLSFLTQPILAALADRSKHFILVKLMIGISVLCALCFFAQLLPLTSTLVIGLCYMAGVWCSDAMIPLTNALSVSYNQAGYTINYGAARGIGSAASATSSLVIGFIIAQLGTPFMFAFLIAARLFCILILLGYPKITKPAAPHHNADSNCSIWTFFIRYRWYCISLLGILFLGMYHAMTESYMITILGHLGGNSSHVGTALFISSIAGAPVIFLSSHIRKHLSDTSMLKIAACSFLLKSILFFFAKQISTIYLLQLLQMTSYSFLAPTQVHYAEAKVRPADMVKGQAFITAAYSLGCSAGNFAGGQLLGFGVSTVLVSGILMALIGTVLIFATVNRSPDQILGQA